MLYERGSAWIENRADYRIREEIQGDGKTELKLEKGGEGFVKNITGSLHSIVNPAYFQLDYAARQTSWVSNYRKINRIANNTSLYFIALEGAALQESPSYFEQFENTDSLLKKYSLSSEQFYFLDSLVTLHWNSTGYKAFHLHAHSLVQYCLGEFPGRQLTFFRLWKDAID